MAGHQLVSPVTRVSLFPRDFERSFSFYRDAIGFTVVQDKSLAGPAVGRLVGLADCTLRVVYLQSEGNDYGMLGLFGVSDPELPEAPKPSAALARGQAVITFGTRDAAALLDRLAAAGAVVLLGPTRYTNPSTGHFVELLVADPDGHLLSFVEFTPERAGLSPTWYG